MRCLFCKKKVGSKFKKPIPVMERLMEKVKVKKGCWSWVGSRDRFGYGRVTMHSGHIERAHRIAFSLAVRRLKPKEQVLHKCDNPPCTRPSHLFAGNNLINMRDMFSKGRRVAAVGRKNGRAKLNVTKVKRIRSMYARGAGSVRSIAVVIGISYVTVRAVLVGRQWKWVPCAEKTAAAIKRRLAGNHTWSFRK